jgi:hypothetical protein
MSEGYTNDLYVVNLTSLQITFLSGSATPYDVSNFGTPKQYSSSTVPAARAKHVMQSVSNNTLLVFGGGIASCRCPFLLCI